jgi:hypothetical protein
MRTLVVILALCLTACGGSGPDQQAAKQQRLYGTERDALEKAKTVNDTLKQADEARRAHEEEQAR